MRKRIWALSGGFVAIALSFFVLESTSGCLGHQCDGSSDDFGEGPGEGALVPNSRDIWESTPLASQWRNYPHQRTLNLHPHVFDGRTITQVFVYNSPDSQPNLITGPDGAAIFPPPGTNFTLASGSLAEVSLFGSSYVRVHNDTCADYFVRVVVEAAPLAPSVDAGTDADGPGDESDGGNG